MNYKFISKYIESKGVDTLCSNCYVMTMFDVIGYDIIFNIVEHDYGIKLNVHLASSCKDVLFDGDVENETELKQIIDNLIEIPNFSNISEQ